jgi:hypothetical protein
MTGPDTEAVRDVRRTAFDWVLAHRGGFTLGDEALAPDGRVDDTWKRLGELAQVCATTVRHTAPDDPVHDIARDLLAFAWEQTGRGALFLEVQRLEPFATYPLEVYGALASAGLRHPDYEEAAALVARTRGWRLTEQTPTRRLGVGCAERLTGVGAHAPGPPAWDRTWLGGRPEPWTFERDSGYALTHVVFHLTDWGRADHGPPPALATYLAHWLPAWLDTCLEAGMWDLSCELLAVAATVSPPAGLPDAPDAWRRIAAARHDTGALPEERDWERAHDAAADFARCYHSTLMAAFAAALTLRHTRQPGAVRHRHARQGVLR